MKKPPNIQKLEVILRASKISAEGFLGSDNRSLEEIIGADLTELAKLDFSLKQVTEKMRQITTLAAEALGNWADIDDIRQAKVDQAKGNIPCPWPHFYHCPKRVTTLENKKTSARINWSDLNIHLIEEHGFFEGKGSPFRLEPKELIEMLF